jgi:hypothetical protein
MPHRVHTCLRPPPCFPGLMTTSVQQRRALRLLADAPHGRAVADLLAHGFTNALLDRLARDGLATIQPRTMRTGTRRITVVWVAITDAGQRALNCSRIPSSGAFDAPLRVSCLGASGQVIFKHYSFGWSSYKPIFDDNCLSGSARNTPTHSDKTPKIIVRTRKSKSASSFRIQLCKSSIVPTIL